MISILAHCGYLSETSRMIEIHRALRAAGVPVRMATHGGVHERLLTAAGIEYDVVGPRLSPERSAHIARTFGQASVRQGMYRDAEMREYVLAEAEYFRDQKTSVAVTGIAVSTLLSTRLAGGVRLATEHAGSFVPPAFERGLLPAPSTPVLGPLNLPGPLARAAANRVTPWLRWYCGSLRRVARELGVETVPGTLAMLLGDLTLVPEIPEVLGIPAAELEAWRPRRGPYRPATRLCYTGPLFAHFDIPMPDEVTQFLETGSGPVVYVALCSTGPDLVRDVVRTLAAGLPDARILVAGTTHQGLESLSSSRVMVAGTLPSHLVMPLADVAVITGGQGSVQTALAAGTAFVGVPLQLEQDLNVALAERLGAATAVAQRAARRGRIVEAVRAILADPGHRAAARRVQELYAEVDGPRNAAEAIAKFAAE